MSELPFVTVVIPCYKRPGPVRKAIESVFAQDYPKDRYELIVVDSSPDEDNAKTAKELEPQAACSYRFIHLDVARGPGVSRNAGAAAGRGSWIAFMDSDCFAHPGWLRNSVAAVEDGVGLVQGKTLPDPDGKPGVFTWCPETLSESVVYECTNILYRREAFEQAGGFPADLNPNSVRPLGGEDMMLGWGVKRLGWRSKFAPESIVYHEVAPMPKRLWFADFRLLLWPAVVAKFPEMRSRLYARYFWDRAQALLALAFLGAGLAFVSPWFLLLAGPYLYWRGSPRSRSFPGPLRPLRVIPWLIRDTGFMIILLAGSLRARALLI